MGAAVCARDCFNCPFPDCIVDEMDADERKAHRDMEKDLMTDPDKKRIAARNKAYREANREEIAACEIAVAALREQVNRPDSDTVKGVEIDQFTRNSHDVATACDGCI